MPRVNWEYKARLTWPVLVAAAKDKRTIFYKDVADKIAINNRNVRLALEPIQQYCLAQGLPPLTAVVINVKDNRPGPGFIAWDIDDIETAQKEVFEFAWDRIGNPFDCFNLEETFETLVNKLLDQDEAEGATRTVRDRGQRQIIFRRLLLEAYGYQCAICGFSFEEALEAAHILPWQESLEGQAFSVNNGILLCSNHHRMFDSCEITISESYKVHYVDENYPDDTYSEQDKAMSVNLHQNKINLPANKGHYPSVQCLRLHNEVCDFGKIS